MRRRWELGLSIFYFARQLPAARDAPQVGQKAPDVTLPDKDGHPVTLSELLDSGTNGTDKGNGALRSGGLMIGS